jgi:hypothetical protein
MSVFLTQINQESFVLDDLKPLRNEDKQRYENKNQLLS